MAWFLKAVEKSMVVCVIMHLSSKLSYLLNFLLNYSVLGTKLIFLILRFKDQRGIMTWRTNFYWSLLKINTFWYAKTVLLFDEEIKKIQLTTLQAGFMGNDCLFSDSLRGVGAESCIVAEYTWNVHLQRKRGTQTLRLLYKGGSLQTCSRRLVKSCFNVLFPHGSVVAAASIFLEEVAFVMSIPLMFIRNV